MLTHRWGLGSELVDYEQAWAEQRAIHDRVVAGGPDEMLLLEHASVYTAGKRTAKWDRPTDGTRVVDVDRGGRITWHGPGQLVVYPILRLVEPVDVVEYVRVLEQSVLDLCAELGVAAERVEGRSGVWVLGVDGGQDRKLAAIGVRVAKGVTMHGVAVNACPDLAAFDAIVACGIEDAGVISLTQLLGRHVSVTECADLLTPHLARNLAAVRAAVAPGAVSEQTEASAAVVH
ncbi:lipoyl(octanoyl) transferase LipB [Occultella gossypii]|uniref:Octanoyltransferase n=1 Tax=Occultella gossypii TaxID=2800820 RepID=A0ABS7S7I7_9MICO|nr:lipoyl(octanoyl) transferase LipB [Occultella gossypii]MBZ2195579.1 lipoyl(octanoyl) transferase LipB [Occultella gossypii]